MNDCAYIGGWVGGWVGRTRRPSIARMRLVSSTEQETSPSFSTTAARGMEEEEEGGR